jgi:uncharacterized protein
MRRLEREIVDREEIDSVIHSCLVCRLGLTDGKEPYIVPLNFGYDGLAFYFHSAPAGRKIDLLRRHNRVCFELESIEGMIEAEEACHWGIRYRSVMGGGTAYLVEDLDEKRYALSLLMEHYSPGSFSFPESSVKATAIIKVCIETISGKQTART